MRVTRMPLSKSSFILSEGSGDNNKQVNLIQQKEVVEWLNKNNINYKLCGNILTLPREEEQTYFILRWMDE